MLLVVSITLPIALKWILIGRWTAIEIPIWGKGYFRFWLVRSLTSANPIMLAKGTPMYNVYLRLLGAKIGRHAVIQSTHVPVCTDLITIGDNAILRGESIVLGYKAESGYIRTGPVTIGNNTVVGEASVLDIDTAMGDGAQLAHRSALLSGQRIPDGESWHGSPAEYAGVDYLDVEPRHCSSMRRALFTWYLLGVIPVGLSAGFIAIYFFLNEVIPSGLPAISVESTLRVAGVMLNFLIVGFPMSLLMMGMMSRILNFLIKEDKVYVLYGIHHMILSFITGASNSKVYNILFGDSSYIIPFLQLIGYRLFNYVQTGSKFGTQQKHHVPTMCEIGRGTMVSSGVTMLNAKFTSTSFRVSKVSMAEDNYLGNDIHYPAGAKVGRNCLLGTRVMLPLHGEVKKNVGLLGSPCFEIPRMSLRDKLLSDIDETTRSKQLRKKNISNFWSMVALILYFWVPAVALVMLAHGLFLLHGTYGDIILYPVAYAVAGAGIAYLVLGEWLSFGFKRLQPKVCSMYEPYFWDVERHWKFTENPLIQLFKGTPFRSMLWRAAGARVGKKLFDDGCGMTEKALVTIGDYCTLNDGCELQAHSLEEGVFKSDHIVVGNGCTVGVQGFVHYGTVVGDNALIDADSFLMKGEVVDAGAVWQGNPARAV